MLALSYLPRAVALLVTVSCLASVVGAEEPSELRRKFLSGSPYEVSIEPPPRPEAAAAQDPAAQTVTGETAAPDTAANSTVGAAAQAAGKKLYTLQLGAFREYKKAARLRDALMKEFGGIEVLETKSGGESLFRVRVGQAPSKSGLADLKAELSAAGYASFAVDAR